MPSMIEDLLNPAFLPDQTKHVKLIQTHISLVFVADEFVYKIKKPVDFGFLDFSTLEKRRYFCQQEVVLNKRLSEGLYLGVMPIVYDGKNYRIGQGGGDVVEYAVRMKRIPDERLMKSIFDRGELTTDHLRDIARVIARFHGHAEHSPEIDHFGELEVFRFTTDENFDQTRKYVGVSIDRKDFETLFQWTDRFFKQNSDLFQRRIDDRKIRDCHGDLHMEHICLTDPISIFDCIEFNDRLRYTDTFADIGFLLMDLEYRGGINYSNQLWRFYAEMTDDTGMEPLLTFYKVYRAYVRGKVISFQLDDKVIDDDEKAKAVQSAKAYFNLARSYIDP
jgi:aminoglycoside phosphotransferase family enzyme